MSSEIDLAAKEGAPRTHDAPHREPYDPARDRERVRGRIAQWLLLLVVAVIAAMFDGLLVGHVSMDELVKLAAVILSPLVGLLGAVVGFYYGEQSRRY